MMSFLKQKVNIDHKMVVLFVIFNFLIMGLYYSYSIFVIKQLKDDISLIAVKKNIINMSSSDLTNNAVTVNANSTKNITINLTNSSSTAMYYRVMHEGVTTGVTVFEKNGDQTSSGQIAASGSVSVLISINNTTSSQVSVKFLVQESISNKFDKEMGTSYVNVSANFDHSGANAPSLPSNMIPVYYVAGSSASEEGSWHKADVNNANSSYIWYDYDNFRWANAVTVSSTNRSTYLNAAAGTEISKSDINAFFVWIPKYKYYVVSADSNSSYEKIINVNFLGRADIDETGTVSCVQDLSTKENPHLYSEVCTDSVYGSVQNNLSTYTHPSFASEDDGFWIGKFANRNYGDFKIIDGVYTENAGAVITNSYARQMLMSGNIYGFAQNSNASYNTNTWLYTNGNTELDAHTITSMEWGAVAILTNSSYGKSNNSMYYNNTEKSFTRVYNNASSQYTGRSTKYTTSSTSVLNTNTTTKYYFDLTNVSHTSNSISYPIGYTGAGASTTGTIYGVFDMAGGNYTTVMGIVMQEDGSLPSDAYKMNAKYYTAYSYSPYQGKINGNDKGVYLEMFRLGDGIKEHVRTFSEKGMWQDGEVEFNNYGILRRGGYTTSGSLFSVSVVNDTTNYETFTVLKYNPA